MLANRDGQVLVVILLVMIVGLTVGLFLLNRTTVDVSLSTNIAESTRAFNAAEAGIEEAIRAGTISSSPQPLASGVTYQVDLQNLGASTTIYPSSKPPVTKVGDVFTLWLVPHNDADGSLVEDEDQAYKQQFLDLCFTTNDPIHPAIAVTVIYLDASGKHQAKYTGYDPDTGSARIATSGFNGTTRIGGCGSAGYDYRARMDLRNDLGIDLTSNGIIPLALRFRPVYAETSIAVIPVGEAIPKQGSQIESIGKAGVTTRRIQVDEKYIVPAPFLDTALYSKGAMDISK